MSPEALDLLRRILGGDLVAVLAEPASPAGHEVEHLAALALENHLERRLRSLGVLNRGAEPLDRPELVRGRRAGSPVTVVPPWQTGSSRS